MKLIEIEAKLAKGGIIQIPKEELDATGLREGMISHQEDVD